MYKTYFLSWHVKTHAYTHMHTHTHTNNYSLMYVCVILKLSYLGNVVKKEIGETRWAEHKLREKSPTGTCARTTPCSTSRASSIFVFLGPPQSLRCLIRLPMNFKAYREIKQRKRLKKALSYKKKCTANKCKYTSVLGIMVCFQICNNCNYTDYHISIFSS